MVLANDLLVLLLSEVPLPYRDELWGVRIGQPVLNTIPLANHFSGHASLAIRAAVSRGWILLQIRNS